MRVTKFLAEKTAKEKQREEHAMSYKKDSSIFKPNTEHASALLSSEMLDRKECDRILRELKQRDELIREER